ncbi:MAG: hypothetical protein V3S37_02505, partial [Dehalococcoidia bacterium]
METARATQVRLAAQVSRSNGIPERPQYVVGTDISSPDVRGVARGAAVVMRVADLTVVEVKCVEGKPGF